VAAREPVARRSRTFLVFLYALRVVATLHALMALSQALSIGQYLDGRYGLLRVHQVIAGLLILVGMALALVALGYVLSGGRLGASGCVVIFLADGLQTGLGYSRVLGGHVPLGVAIITLSLVIAVWSWTPGAGRPRPRSGARLGARPGGRRRTRTVRRGGDSA
jgi:hypothetical protein